MTQMNRRRLQEGATSTDGLTKNSDTYGPTASAWIRQQRIDRRQMLRRSAAIAVGVHVGVAASTLSASPNERLNIASIGVGGKGWSDMHETSVGQNLVAICDVDESRLARAATAFPGTRQYTDWRRLLEQTGIDAVTVSTPDHMHAPIALSAMQLGKHVYVQKPLSHSVFEARQLTNAAERSGVVTQMGIQHHSAPRFKTAVRLLREGAIGKIKETHVWTDRPLGFWKQALDRPTGKNKVPSSFHWDHWLGVAPDRPYVHGAYHPFQWRAFWDFGTGALGDMGCHAIDPVATAVELPAPSRVWAEGPRPNGETGPEWSIVNYQFPGTSHTVDPFRLTWYDGGQRPSRELFGSDEYSQWKNGLLFVGQKGLLLVDYENPPRLLPEDKFADVQVELEPGDNHYLQWTEACKGNGKTATPFSYSGPLTETVLLGNVAVRLGKPIDWDREKLSAQGEPAADAFIRREYRKEWRIEGL